VIGPLVDDGRLQGRVVTAPIVPIIEGQRISAPSHRERQGSVRASIFEKSSEAGANNYGDKLQEC
jgi:hypothetical protein